MVKDSFPGRPRYSHKSKCFEKGHYEYISISQLECNAALLCPQKNIMIGTFEPISKLYVPDSLIDLLQNEFLPFTIKILESSGEYILLKDYEMPVNLSAFKNELENIVGLIADIIPCLSCIERDCVVNFRDKDNKFLYQATYSKV